MRILVSSLLASLCLTAPAAAQGAFPTEEAARCGAVFARMVQAMEGASNVPETTRTAAALGLAFWEYELTASAPGETERLKSAVLSAFDALQAEMPDGENEAGARGDFLMARAKICSDKLDAAYPEGNHPVVAQLRKSQGDAEAEDRPPGLR